MNKLNSINDFIIKNSKAINDWLTQHYGNVSKPIYTSVDIRLADFKISHVDTNLFPAGFNNLSHDAIKKAIKYLKEFLHINFPKITKILIIPENFSRNIKYLESLRSLHSIFINAGVETISGSPFLQEDKFDSEVNFEIKAMIRSNNKLQLPNGWQPDLIILNNDLTNGIPEILQNLDQPIIPSLGLGWHARSKHKHFEAFDTVLNSFCASFNFDPWLFSTYYEYCGCIDFKNKQGLECLAKSAENIINKLKEKYKEYDIKEAPYIFIKADKGTYGMGIMSVRNPEKILSINKKHRHSMNVIKSGVQNTQVMIQEGIPTSEIIDGYPAESLAYMIGGKVVEIFSRLNKNTDKYSNLNSRGMEFSPQFLKYHELKVLVAELAALSVAFEK